MASLNTLFLCSVGHQAWVCSWLVLKSFVKTKAFVLIKLFLYKKECTDTAWKVSKYGVISGPYFSAFGLNTGKYGPEITPYLETFHAVWD